MIFVTGDIHGDPRRLSNHSFPAGRSLTKDDFVIICGDFGLVWDYHGESDTEKYNLNWLNDRPFTTLFVDGNHENFDRLNAFPVTEWNGGKVHKVRDSVIHLMRGQVYDIPCGEEAKRIFTFGGAASHDIEDGILDPVTDKEKIKKWNHHNVFNGWPYKMFRVNKQSWWAEEMPSDEEIEEGLNNLDKVGWEVDYVFTHDCASTIMRALGYDKASDIDKLNSFLEVIREKLVYGRWFFGHHHNNIWLSEKDRMLYETIESIDVKPVFGFDYEL